jgi:hypothetical protein
MSSSQLDNFKRQVYYRCITVCGERLKDHLVHIYIVASRVEIYITVAYSTRFFQSKRHIHSNTKGPR